MPAFVEKPPATSHLAASEISTYMSSNAVDDLHALMRQARFAVDERGRSAQTFLVEVVAGSGGVERRAVRAAGTSMRSPHPGRRGSLSGAGRSRRHRRRRLGRCTVRRKGLPGLAQPGTPNPRVTGRPDLAMKRELTAGAERYDQAAIHRPLSGYERSLTTSSDKSAHCSTGCTDARPTRR